MLVCTGEGVLIGTDLSTMSTMGTMVTMSASATLTAKTARMSAARDVTAALQTLMSLVEHLFIALCLAGRAAWLEVLGFRLVVVRMMLDGLILDGPAFSMSIPR